MPEPIHAPELTGAVDWLNVPRPLTLKSDLKGKIVLLDFWTYGCINCLHILPDLQRLEEKYRDELVVVGIHSAKLVAAASGEGRTEAFDEAIAAVQMVFDERGELNRAPIPQKLEGVGEADRELRFPGKIPVHWRLPSTLNSSPSHAGAG